LKNEYTRKANTAGDLELETQYYIIKNRNGVLSDAIVKPKIAELEDKLVFAKASVSETFDEELEIRGLLNFGREFIRTIEFAWSEAPIEYKLKLQRLIFPEGLKYHYNGFSNSRLSPAFNLINQSAPKNSNAGDPASTLNRLREFLELFLSDGLNSEFAYQFGLKNV